jgi:quinol monooxygenase YgiN
MPEESENPPVILINVFTVEPQNQQRLIDILTSATHGSVDQEPGFISATLHRSLDGSKVTMYAKWRDAEAYAAMRRKPGRSFLAQALEIAKFEPGMYEIVQTFLAPTADNAASGADR